MMQCSPTTMMRLRETRDMPTPNMDSIIYFHLFTNKIQFFTPNRYRIENISQSSNEIEVWQYAFNQISWNRFFIHLTCFGFVNWTLTSRFHIFYFARVMRATHLWVCICWHVLVLDQREYIFVDRNRHIYSVTEIALFVCFVFVERFVQQWLVHVFVNIARSQTLNKFIKFINLQQ